VSECVCVCVCVCVYVCRSSASGAPFTPSCTCSATRRASVRGDTRRFCLIYHFYNLFMFCFKFLLVFFRSNQFLIRICGVFHSFIRMQRGDTRRFFALLYYWFSVFHQFSLCTARGDTPRFLCLFVFSFHQFSVYTARGGGHTQTLAHLNIQMLNQSGGGHGG
jgi:hypothetical protein